METEGTDEVGETTGRNDTIRYDTTRRDATRQHDTRKLYNLIFGYQEDIFRNGKDDRDLTYFESNCKYLTGIIGIQILLQILLLRQGRRRLRAVAERYIIHIFDTAHSAQIIRTNLRSQTVHAPRVHIFGTHCTTA